MKYVNHINQTTYTDTYSKHKYNILHNKYNLRAIEYMTPIHKTKLKQTKEY